METKTASRWERTGSVGDDALLWTSSAKISVTETPRGARTSPARRAALAKAEEEAKEMKKKAEEMKKKAKEMKKKAEEMKKEAASGAVSPRTAARKPRRRGWRARSGGGDGGVFAGTR